MKEHLPRKELWISAMVMELFQDEDINAKEMLLLAVVDSFARRKNRCFASNSWFASFLKVDQRMAELLISSLANKGHLIRVKKEDGRRELLTRWTYDTVSGETRIKIRDPLVKNYETYPQKITGSLSLKRELTNKDIHNGFIDESFESKCTKKLHKIILNYFQDNKSTNYWKSWFAKLQSRTISQDRIKRVLIWYGKNIGTKYVPLAQDAKEFHDKFLNIELRMKETNKEVPEHKAVISEEAQKIANDLVASLTWPRGSALQLPRVVEASLINYRKWQAKRMRFIEALPPENRNRQSDRDIPYKKIDEELDAFAFTQTSSFIPLWFRNVSRKLAKWKDWNGNLDYFIVTENHPDFQALGAEIVQKYMGRADAWENYFNLVNEN